MAMGLFGGLALFLFGMEQMSDSLKSALGEQMKVLLGKLTRIPGVTGVHSSFELRRVIQRTALPLDHIAEGR